MRGENHNTVQVDVEGNNKNSILNWSPSQRKAMQKVAERIHQYQKGIAVNAAGLPIAYIDAEYVSAHLYDAEKIKATPEKRRSTDLESDGFGGVYSVGDEDEDMDSAETEDTEKGQENATAESKATPSNVVPFKNTDLAVHAPPEAVIPISYIEGYAATGGLPIWERLDGETFEHYELFKAYRNAKTTVGHRTYKLIADRTMIPAMDISTIAQIYYWNFRCDAFDRWERMQKQVRAEADTEELMGRHKKVAKEVFELCSQFLEEHKEELTPRVALQWMEMAIKLERLSLGLPGDKPPTTEEEDSKRTPINVTAAIQNIQNNNNAPDSKEKPEERIGEILHVLNRVGGLSSATQALSNGTDVVDAEVINDD